MLMAQHSQLHTCKGVPFAYILQISATHTATVAIACPVACATVKFVLLDVFVCLLQCTQLQNPFGAFSGTCQLHTRPTCLLECNMVQLKHILLNWGELTIAT
jgi:hypothetical protein